MNTNGMIEQERDRTLQEQAERRRQQFADAAFAAQQQQAQVSNEAAQNNAILRNSTDLLRDSSSRSL